ANYGRILSSSFRRELPQFRELRLLRGRQEILDANEEADLGFLDLLFEGQDAIDLGQDFRLVDRLLLEELPGFLRLALEVELQIHEPGLHSSNLAADAFPLGVAQADLLAVPHHEIRREESGGERVVASRSVFSGGCRAERNCKNETRQKFHGPSP